MGASRPMHFGIDSDGWKSPLLALLLGLPCSMLLVSALSSEPEGSECKDSSWTGSRWMDVSGISCLVTKHQQR